MGIIDGSLPSVAMLEAVDRANKAEARVKELEALLRERGTK